MDFISVLASLGAPGAAGLVNVIYIVLLVWLIVLYLPKREKLHAVEREKRDNAFLKVIDSYRESLEKFQEKEEESHGEIIKMIVEHDKHAIQANEKIAQILTELQRRN